MPKPSVARARQRLRGWGFLRAGYFQRWASQGTHLLFRLTWVVLTMAVLSDVAATETVDSLQTITSSLEATGTAECHGPMLRDIPYLESLRLAIERCFVLPPALEDGARCEVRVSQTTQGLVRGVEVLRCTGHPNFADFVERAILKASPLPRPGRESSFLPTFGIVFSPNVAKIREAARAAPMVMPELRITLAATRPPVGDRGIQKNSNDELSIGPVRRFVVANRAGKYQRYVDACLKKVLDIGNKHYPPEARGRLYGKAILTLAVLPSGELSVLELDRSSGHRLLDDALLEAARLAGPFDPFSIEMAREVQSLWITVPLTYGPAEGRQGEAQPSGEPNQPREPAAGRLP